MRLEKGDHSITIEKPDYILLKSIKLQTKIKDLHFIMEIWDHCTNETYCNDWANMMLGVITRCLMCSTCWTMQTDSRTYVQLQLQARKLKIQRPTCGLGGVGPKNNNKYKKKILSQSKGRKQNVNFTSCIYYWIHQWPGKFMSKKMYRQLKTWDAYYNPPRIELGYSRLLRVKKVDWQSKEFAYFATSQLFHLSSW